MSIDWITVAAQIVNFLVLVWLLRRFLYRPILDGIDARENEITTRMQEAGRAKQKADAVEREYLDELKSLHAQQSTMKDAIRQESEKQRDALLVDAREQLARERAAWTLHLDEEARDYTLKLHRAGGDALLSLTRKALTDLADETLEDRIAQHLVKQIEPMEEDLRAAAGGSAVAVVTSRDALTKSAQDSLADGLKTVFPDVDVQFQTNVEQPLGVILRIGGAQLDWTVDGYIDGLSDLMQSQLAEGVDIRGAAR